MTCWHITLSLLPPSAPFKYVGFFFLFQASGDVCQETRAFPAPSCLCHKEGGVQVPCILGRTRGGVQQVLILIWLSAAAW